jgi:type II secretory pathway pseudopilin PulG
MPKRLSDTGFTLIEALVTCVIFALMSVAIISLLLTSVTVARANSLDSHAVALAIQEKEDVRSISYPVVAGLTTRDPYPTASPNLFNGTSFTVHSDISADQPIANVCTIITTVSWSHMGSTRSYVLRSIYAAVNS